tara:strand:- start:3187 stop:3576 length:390 start_codon:yes stop_codon:yes gene_type:complete
MSKLETIVIVSDVLRNAMQTYDKATTYYNIGNNKERLTRLFNEDRFDIFGYLTPGYFFGSHDDAEEILNFMNDERADVVFTKNESNPRPFFINKRTTKAKVNSVKDILDIVNDQVLSRKTITRKFIYEY